MWCKVVAVQIRLEKTTIRFLKDYRKFIEETQILPVKMQPSITKVVNSMVRGRIRALVPTELQDRFKESTFEM